MSAMIVNLTLLIRLAWCYGRQTSLRRGEHISMAAASTATPAKTVGSRIPLSRFPMRSYPQPASFRDSDACLHAYILAVLRDRCARLHVGDTQVGMCDLQPEQVAEELATGVSSTAEWRALAAHRAEIEKTCASSKSSAVHTVVLHRRWTLLQPQLRPYCWRNEMFTIGRLCFCPCQACNSMYRAWRTLWMCRSCEICCTTTRGRTCCTMSTKASTGRSSRTSRASA